MTQIVWIASYPRSGNTWLRFLVANLLHANIESSAQLSMMVPDIHRFVTGRHLLGPERSFIKTHWAWRPDFPLRENTQAVVYLLRHPLDVVESALNYAARGAGAFVRDAPAAEIDRFARSFVAEFVDYGGAGSWYRQGFGSWIENVASWTERALPFPRHVVRYEALRDDPPRQLEAIARFAGLPASMDRIAAAVEQSSLERLGAIEEEELKSESPGIFFGQRFQKSSEAGFRFIGGEDRRRLTLTEDERAKLRERFGTAMRQLGYE
jgi:hypothetical protein